MSGSIIFEALTPKADKLHEMSETNHLNEKTRLLTALSNEIRSIAFILSSVAAGSFAAVVMLSVKMRGIVDISTLSSCCKFLNCDEPVAS